MRLTVFTDYSLRVLIYAGLFRDRLVTISEISGAYDISRNHLMKVVHHLARGGYLETIRGKGGGFRLMRDPDDIGLGRLVRETEAESVPVECMDPQRQDCRILPACRLKHCIAEAEQAFYSALDKYTLADLLGNEKRLVRLLIGESSGQAMSGE